MFRFMSSPGIALEMPELRCRELLLASGIQYIAGSRRGHGTGSLNQFYRGCSHLDLDSSYMLIINSTHARLNLHT